MTERTKGHFGASAFDEAFDGDGRPRGAYADFFERLDAPALQDASEWVRIELARRGVVFGGGEPHPFDVDPVPRIIGLTEWKRVEAGLIQRVRALNEFFSDVYRERRIVAAGIIPQRVIDGAEWFEPAMAEPGFSPVRAHVAGPDLVRCPDGELRVLEDNLRAPSGLAYLLAAREAIAPLILASGLRPLGLDSALAALREALRSAAPRDVEEPHVVLLTDGPAASAFYENRELARLLGLRLATTADLMREGERLLVRGERGRAEREVHVIYRRIDDERLTAPDGRPTALGELVVEPLRRGRLGCVNSPGSGIGDDKAVHTYVERMIDFYLGEPPLLASVHGYDLGDPAQLAEALPLLDELVVKPRSEFGGSGVHLGPLAGEEERREMRALVRSHPERFVAQEPVALSTHPTVVEGKLRGRHVDLRPFVISSDAEISVAAGGLTRFAREEDEMVVNSGRGGGAKDTWILGSEAE